ncbi:MAG TPA: LysM domain-containing protein, partial [Acidimicrobiales bacterium]|nr:LysM domain-containing protein [Acidimicrobiales bacterium]
PRRAAIHARPEELERSRRNHPTAAPRPSSAPPAPGRRPERSMVLPSRRAQDRAAQVRARTLARRRRTLAVVVGGLALVALALPLRALGATSLTSGGYNPGSVYVVQPGDTLASIAAKLDPGHDAATEAQLAASTGSRYVTPGEHVVVP